MNSRLTLRVDNSLIKKAKLLAREKGTSVSKLFREYITEQTIEIPVEQLPSITKSMIGAMKSSDLDVTKDNYHAYLEDKYL